MLRLISGCSQYKSILLPAYLEIPHFSVQHFSDSCSMKFKPPRCIAAKLTSTQRCIRFSVVRKLWVAFGPALYPVASNLNRSKSRSSTKQKWVSCLETIYEHRELCTSPEKQEVIKYELSPTRFAYSATTGGKTIVDIREYYADEGSAQLKPSKKGGNIPIGITLRPEQWSCMLSQIPHIDAQVNSLQNGTQKVGPKLFQLSPTKFLSVSVYKDQLHIDIRKYLLDGNKLRPAKIGISLQVAEWDKLKSYADKISGDLKQLEEPA